MFTTERRVLGKPSFDKCGFNLDIIKDFMYCSFAHAFMLSNLFPKVGGIFFYHVQIPVKFLEEQLPLATFSGVMVGIPTYTCDHFTLL